MSGSASMPSRTPAQSPAAKTVGTLVRMGVIDRGDPAAERRGEHEAGADEVEQLHVGREAEGEADRVARDLALTAGDRIEVAVDWTSTTDSISPTRPRASRIV